MPLSLAVFDLDGTLIDSAPDLHRTVNLTLAEFGCAPLSFGQTRAMIGDGISVLVSRALAASGCPATDQATALQRFLAHYEADPTAHTEVYPGAKATLDILRNRGVSLAICTHKPIRPTGVILKRLGLDGYFARVIGGDSLPFRKPDPRVLLEILRGLGAVCEDSLMIGDSEVDAATAHGAGVPFALMTHGYHRCPPDQIPCVARFDHFDALAGFIAGLC